MNAGAGGVGGEVDGVAVSDGDEDEEFEPDMVTKYAALKIPLGTNAGP